MTAERTAFQFYGQPHGTLGWAFNTNAEPTTNLDTAKSLTAWKTPEP
jgi:hypothetical protein